MMYKMEKSDGAVVATNATNNGQPAELREQRASAKGKPQEPHTHQAQDWTGVSQGMERLRQCVLRNPKEKRTTLLHHITVEGTAFLALKHGSRSGWGIVVGLPGGS